jgi:hypothetical protein
MPQEWLAGADSGRQVERREGLAGAPLAREQAVPLFRNQSLGKPALERARVGLAVLVERRQVGVLNLVVVVQLRVLLLPWRVVIIAPFAIRSLIVAGVLFT